MLIVVLFHWKLTLTNQYTWLQAPDNAYQVLPWFQFQAAEWHSGRFPLWDPNGLLGQPLFGQGQPGSAYPPNWLLFLLPLWHGWVRQNALNWYFVLIRCGAALACYALARDLGRSRVASVLAGCVYALGGYVAYTDWPQNVNGAVWTPLVLLYLLRAERGERPWASALLSGFLLGFGWLAGHHQMNLFVSLAVAALWIWVAVRSGRVNWRIARLAACALTTAAAASAFVTIPMAEYGRLAVRWVGTPEPFHLGETVPYTLHQQYSLKPVESLGIFIPNIAQNYNPYIGVVALTIGILGALLAWRERQARWLTAIAAGGLFFSLGPNSILHGILYSLVPFVDKARVPSAGILVFSVGVAPLVAYGLDLLPRPESRVALRRAAWVLAAVSAIISTASLIFLETEIPLRTDDRLMIPAIAAALAGAVFGGWLTGGISVAAGSVCLTGLALFEMGNVTSYFLYNEAGGQPGPYLHRLAEHGDLIDYLRRQGQAFRIDYDQDLIPYNLGDWYGIDTLSAYVPSVVASVPTINRFAPRARDFLGIRYYLGSKPFTPGQVEVFTGRSGIKVFENTSAFPRVWSVHRVAESGAVSDPGFDARHDVVVADQPPPEIGLCRPGGDDVQMPLHLPNRIRITADLKCRGMVVLTDNWFPGWRAAVDGRRAQIYNVDGGVRGVVVEGGRHVIEMVYRPMSVILGGAMTLLAAIATALVWTGAFSFQRSAISDQLLKR